MSNIKGIDTEVHNVVSADSTVVDDNIYRHVSHLSTRNLNNIPHAHRATAFHYNGLAGRSKLVWILTFLTSKRGLSLLEDDGLLAAAAVAWGGSTSIGVDILPQIIKSRCN